MQQLLQSQYGARNRRLKANSMSYKDYLCSDFWKQIKIQLKSFPEFRKCYGCETTKNLEMHHKHYRHIFSKKLHHHRDAILPLCRKCHQESHDLSFENGWGLSQAARRVRKMNCL